MNVPPPPPPFAAPTPHRYEPEMAHNLENYRSNSRGPSPVPPPPPFPSSDMYRPGPPPQSNYNPGFSGGFAGSPPPPRGNDWSPWNIPSLPAGAAPPQGPQGYSSPPPMPSHSPSIPQPYAGPSLSESMNNMNLSSSRTPSPSSSNSLTSPLPVVPSLLTAMPTVQQPNHDPALKVAWCRDVLFLVDKAAATAASLSATYPATSSTEIPTGPVTIDDPQLSRLAQVAVPMILHIAGGAPSGGGMPVHIAEALYHRACLTASGAFPEHIKQNPRSAFRDFEASARAGYSRAWFRIGRDYEAFGDNVHAKECFERGAKNNVDACLYRMGMAHLLGQLGLPSKHEVALPLLHRAALASSLDSPQPAYVYALLLLGEFTQMTVNTQLFHQLQLIPSSFAHAPNGLQKEAKVHLERSAYLHFAPAQYKLGHAYEFAVPPWDFDALLSVEWYSRASQQGEVEADMALSKWFLCGSSVQGPNGEVMKADNREGFEKDEGLARVFAEKAAKRGLPSAEFAMGYYCEVGVGGVKDIKAAVDWYTKARDHGNADASERLAALSQPDPQSLSRAEHDTITENKLVRSRTQAKQRSEAQKVRDGYMEKQTQPPQGPPLGMPQYQQQPYPPPQHQRQPSYPQQQPYPPHHQPSYPQSNPPYPQQQPYSPQQQPPPRRDGKQVVDLIRKNTLENHRPQQGHGHGRYMSESGGGAPPPPPGQAPYNGPGTGARPGGRQQYPGAHRYTLVDPGSSSASPSQSDSRTTSPLPMPGAGPGGRPGPPPRVSSAQGASSSPSSRPQAAPPGPKKAAGPQTFAEMGFQGAKAEDKDCVIM